MHRLNKPQCYIRFFLSVCACLIQYDFVELLDGSRLIAKEKRGLVEVEGAARKARSVNVHEAEFIRFLDSGTWHLAFYNDGKNTEQVSYNTIIIGKQCIYVIFVCVIWDQIKNTVTK